jgi:hypothetical protein
MTAASGLRARAIALVAAVFAVFAVFAFGGCGGSSRSEATTPADPAEGASEAESGEGGEMISAETMEEIKRNLDRKRRIISHCLASAVDAKELPRNSAGKITLEIVISPAGKAETVKVLRATLESKMLTDCVIDRVKEIQFPQLPRPYPTSYTYGFEAM